MQADDATMADQHPPMFPIGIICATMFICCFIAIQDIRDAHEQDHHRNCLAIAGKLC